MFSYSFKVRKLNSASKLKAFVTLVIDDVLEIDGFKVIDGSKGLFVSVPSHKGTVMEDGIKVDKYFDDVRFQGEEGATVGTEIKDAMLQAYMSDSGQSSSATKSDPVQSRATAAKAQANIKAAPAPKKAPARDKPIWGF